MGNKFTQKAQNSLNRALTFAGDMGHTYIGSEHILYGLSEEKDSIAAKILISRGASPEKIKECIEELSGKGAKSSVTPYDMTPRARKIIENSAKEADASGNSFIGTEHILLSLLDEKECIGVRILSSLGVKTYELNLDLAGIGSSVSEQKKDKSKPTAEEKSKIKGAATLSLYGKELTEQARMGKLDPIIGREKETERVIQILSRRTKNNPCLIGEPGVGKTAVVEGLAERIAAGTVPPTLLGKRIVTLDLSSMIAGSKYRGEFEERMKNVMEDVRRNPDIILFIDEIHMIIGAGAAEGAVDAANIIKPALARGEIQAIGATTISEYRLRIEKDAALERRFQSVTVNEPDTEGAIGILSGLREKYEEHHKLKISNEAISAAVTLSQRYIPDRYLPDKAIDLLDEAASKLRISASALSRDDSPEASRPKLEEKLKIIAKKKEKAIIDSDFSLAASLHSEEIKLKEQLTDSSGLICANTSDKNFAALSQEVPTVGAEDIAAIVTEWTGIPVASMGDGENERLIHLEERLSADIIGQDGAIKAVGNAIRRGRLGFKSPNRPIGTFIFYGPTGVGKTALAKALARELFGDEDSLIRFDMSEYMESHSISKLIGSPPGYVGYEEGGRLTEKVRRRPYSVVLFDEIEKAHHDIFNLMLQILDEGSLTDSAGRRVDFKNTVIIMTACSQSAASASSVLGFSDTAARQSLPSSSSLKSIFSPEFLARIDEILLFDSLGEAELLKISRNMLEHFKSRARDMGLKIDFAPSVSELLAEEAYKANSGARPLRRAIVHHIENCISNAILRGDIKWGDCILCSAEDKKIKLVVCDTVLNI